MSKTKAKKKLTIEARQARSATRKQNRQERLTTAYEGQGGQCYYCRCAMVNMFAVPEDARHLHAKSKHRATWDHKIPRSRGGHSTPDNLVVACDGCNNAKGDLTDLEFLDRDIYLMALAEQWEAETRDPLTTA